MRNPQLPNSNEPNINPLTRRQFLEQITLVTKNGHFGHRVTDDGHTYDIMLCDGLFDKLNPTLAQIVGKRRVFVVEDPNVHKSYGKLIREYFEFWEIASCRFSLPEQAINEENKDSGIATRLSVAFQDDCLSDYDLVIIIGGGVTKDVVAFAAKKYRRGVPICVIATTVLAMVDAAPSPKCAVNVEGRKNLWSDRHYPEVVLYDPTLLATLDDNAFFDGLAEVAKVAIIGSPDLFRRLENSPLQALKKDLLQPKRGTDAR